MSFEVVTGGSSPTFAGLTLSGVLSLTAAGSTSVPTLQFGWVDNTTGFYNHVSDADPVYGTHNAPTLVITGTERYRFFPSVLSMTMPAGDNLGITDGTRTVHIGNDGTGFYLVTTTNHQLRVGVFAAAGPTLTLPISGAVTLTHTPALVLSGFTGGIPALTAGKMGLGFDATFGATFGGNNTGGGGYDITIVNGAGSAVLAVPANSQNIVVVGQATFGGAVVVAGAAVAALTSSATFTSGAGAQVGTLTNAPAAGNPTSWVKIVDNGVTRYIPAW